MRGPGFVSTVLVILLPIGCGPTPVVEEDQPSLGAPHPRPQAGQPTVIQLRDRNLVTVAGLVHVVEAGKIKGIAGAAVYVSDLPKEVKFPVPSEPVVLRFRGKRLVPPSACVQVGQTLLVEDDDKETHAPHFSSRRRPPAASGLPPGHPATFSTRFEEPEECVLVSCDIHPSERAWVTVVPSPWHTMSTDDGSFRLPRELPPGQYTLRAYHAEWGRAVKPFSLRAGGASEVHLELQLGAAAARQ